MKDFVYCAPTKVVLGRNTEEQAGALLREFGATKVLIHYGGGSAVKSGLLDRVCRSVEEAGIPYVLL
ncbi:MAG: iron-containing alcohol dehydrogenase, partial [Oscillospiraceae bacterium]|nr:iron-containing alcohol dehydrogenase [Oscillospiraceae bacterium]